MPTDDLAQVRQLRDDLRRLKEPYPELVEPASQLRLASYLQTEREKEDRMPAKGDRTLGEDLVNVTFKVQASVMDTVEQHLRMLQRTTRDQRIGKGDALRDIFLRGIDTIENPPQPFPVELSAAQLPLSTPPVEPAATTAGGAIPPAPAYEARVLTPEAGSQADAPRRRRVASPLDRELEDMPLEPALDVTQESAVPAAPAEAPPREAPDWSVGSTWSDAFAANPLAVPQDRPAPAAPVAVVTPPPGRKTARPKTAAKPKPKTARSTKGRKETMPKKTPEKTPPS